MGFRFGRMAAAGWLAAIGGTGVPGGPAAARAALAGADGGRVFVSSTENAAAAIAGGSQFQHAATVRAAWLRAGHPVPTSQDRQALALTGGTVLSNTLQVGDAFAFPAIAFSYTAGTPGLQEAQFGFTSKAGPKVVTVTYGQSVYSKQGSVSFAYPAAIPYYMARGAWTLTSATLYDNSGASVSYSAGQLTTLFNNSSFNVLNGGPVDSQAPVLGVGHLLTPTVSLSSAHPAIKATLQVSDGLTGVATASLFLNPPGQTYSFAQIVTIPLPVRSGTVTLYDSLSPSDATGTYTIHEVIVCDVANNCDTVTDPNAVFNLLGANSVTVTN